MLVPYLWTVLTLHSISTAIHQNINDDHLIGTTEWSVMLFR